MNHEHRSYLAISMLPIHCGFVYLLAQFWVSPSQLPVDQKSLNNSLKLELELEKLLV